MILWFNIIEYTIYSRKGAFIFFTWQKNDFFVSLRNFCASCDLLKGGDLAAANGPNFTWEAGLQHPSNGYDYWLCEAIPYIFCILILYLACVRNYFKFYLDFTKPLSNKTSKFINIKQWKGNWTVWSNVLLRNQSRDNYLSFLDLCSLLYLKTFTNIEVF